MFDSSLFGKPVLSRIERKRPKLDQSARCRTELSYIAQNCAESDITVIIQMNLSGLLAIEVPWVVKRFFVYLENDVISGAQKNTAQLAKYQRVLYVKPWNKIYLLRIELSMKNLIGQEYSINIQ